MSSILTNTSAMVALQTLRGINKNLAQTQSEISTGKSVANARDNAAVWAISKTMESDVKGFKGISDSLALGKSTVGVARQAAETVTDLLTQMKGRIVAAQESNVDRAKIQEDVDALRDQIRSVVNAAQFNGLNLVNGSTAGADVLASLDRDSAGTVTARQINVAASDLSSLAAAVVAGLDGDGVSADGSVIATFIDDGDSIAISIDADGNMAAGDRYVINISGRQVAFTITQADLDDATDPNAVIAAGVRTAIQSLGIDGLTVDLDGDELTISNEAGSGRDLAFSMRTVAAGSGGLSGLNGIDVSTDVGAQDALAEIEGLIRTSIEAASSFGSAQMRIDTQAEFIKNLTDSLNTGIGALVDADMEAASARLQALQVQQQLATQSLSIANQQPQNILALFR
ncbi:MAG: flagellin [Roseinatronobacter sp.]